MIFLDIEETAILLRIKKQTLYQLVNARKIPYRKAGGKLLFEKKEIDAWTKLKAHPPLEA